MTPRLFPAFLAFAAALCGAEPAAITVDYPAEGSIFPPEIAAPTFLWHDASPAAAEWRIRITFAGGSPALYAVSKGPPPQLGEIDPDCVAETNQPPQLTPYQAGAHTWKPAASLWEAIKKRSLAGAATVAITGYSRAGAVSRGHVTIHTSRDPVGAPIFYRDVPLMPTETQAGVIKPLAPHAVRLITWRLRNVAEPRSRVVMESVPVCANCHSFSADGRTLGMDLDGLQNNRGLYMLAPVAPETTIGTENVLQWKTAAGRLESPLRVGFMSQISPDGRHVVTTIDKPSPGSTSPSNYYVANFKDYRFLQVFYPTRGILSWFSRETGVLQPLPGADDPRYVQTGAVWSPDGQYLVFARAPAQEPHGRGAPVAQFAGDGREQRIQYDLYRVPFSNGSGGRAEPIAGASRNGRSNTFPKVSPDGRWIVYVQCRNGLLMRPDSELYIVPASGGEARRMNCNTPLMNSWHSFSPNGRWMVFSSKARSPYTQMYLTHIDAEGRDSPAILIEDSTAANRAVNLPEFVNIAPGGLRRIAGPALDYYRLFDRALYLQKEARFEESAEIWRKVLAIRPEDTLAHRNLGITLMALGRRKEAAPYFRGANEIQLRKAVEANPDSATAHDKLGAALLEAGRAAEAVPHFETALRLDPKSAAARCHLGMALAAQGRSDEALVQFRQAAAADPRYAPAQYELGLILSQRGATRVALVHWRKAIELDPKHAEARFHLAAAIYDLGAYAEAVMQWREGLRLRPADAGALAGLARALATCPDTSIRNGTEAVALAARAVQLTAAKDPGALDALAAAYAEKGRFDDAALTARRAIERATESGNTALAEAIRGRLARYEAGAR